MCEWQGQKGGPRRAEQGYRDRAPGGDQGRAYRLAVETDRGEQQPRTARQHATLVPQQINTLADAPALPITTIAEGFAGGSAAETEDLPAQEQAVLTKFDVHAAAGIGMIEDDAFLRQPFDHRIVRQMQLD